MPDIITFADAIADSERFKKRHLILGNGFSIGCRANIFHYASLFGEADFSAVPELEDVFEALGCPFHLIDPDGFKVRAAVI